jgi:AcrR family transcriptional regulator
MEAIAAEAAVALKTVYSAFATKSGVLRALWDLRLKGDADDAPVNERPWYREMLDEPDPRRQVAMMAANARLVRSRIGPLLRTIRSAAAVDADAGALWQLIQSDFYAMQRALVVTVAERGHLRPGLGVERATDILTTLNHPDVWLLLVGDRGWSPEEFETWFTEIVTQQLFN